MKLNEMNVQKPTQMKRIALNVNSISLVAKAIEQSTKGNE